jgi:hypothetical protein
MPKVEVSVGEIIDKVTILQIKQNKIKDKVKLRYVEEELWVLLEVLETEGIHIPDALFEELLHINQELWDTEDIIRELENKQNFDKKFIEHARLDAKLNDKRFLVKNKINEQSKSLVKEQKSYERLYTAN